MRDFSVEKGARTRETLVLVAEGDLVAGHFTGRGTHHGVFQGIPRAVEPWEASCTAIYRIEDDRIADGWVTWNHLSLLHQLGAVERVSTVSA
jgi:predicted ester cyclase